ncbi:MAG: CNNM domain-containing protein [Planctomycetota bacterium]
MTELIGYLPGLATLLAISGFFSGSEAAFFSLTPSQRAQLSSGSTSDRLATRLIAQSEQLLMGILFWNLAINISYFSVVSKASMSGNESSAAIVTVGSLLAIILCGEFLPKSIAVMYPLAVVRLTVYPLSLALRLVSPVLPIVRLVNEGSRRLLWPGFQSEPYLDVADLDRAVSISVEDDHLFKQESEVLRNVIQLSEIRVEEWMRPRTQYRAFRPPVQLSHLAGERTPSGYMLVTDPKGHDVESVIDLSTIKPEQNEDTASLLEPLVVVPWCASVADAFVELKSRELRVAVVVNEFGDSIGVLTWEDVVEAILQPRQSSSQKALAKAEIVEESPGVWLATGMTKLRRLERILGRKVETQGLTVAGVLQEHLHRLAEEGDVCQLADLEFRVLEADLKGELLVRISVRTQQERGSS